MATAVKNKDFVEIDFIGKIKSNGVIFDLTVAEEAKKAGIFESNRDFSPVIFCIGAKQMIQGLDEAIVGKKISSEFEVDVKPEKAFGKRNSKLFQMVPLVMLKKQGINPVPGMPLNLDGVMAKVRSVSSGRVILDFNHPLAGQELHYWIKINKLVTDPKAQIEAIAKLMQVQVKVAGKDKEYSVKITAPNEDKIKAVFKEEVKKHVSKIKVKFL